jgi:hypothetical protein
MGAIDAPEVRDRVAADLGSVHSALASKEWPEVEAI